MNLSYFTPLTIGYNGISMANWYKTGLGVIQGGIFAVKTREFLGHTNCFWIRFIFSSVRPDSSRGKPHRLSGLRSFYRQVACVHVLYRAAFSRFRFLISWYFVEATPTGMLQTVTMTWRVRWCTSMFPSAIMSLQRFDWQLRSVVMLEVRWERSSMLPRASSWTNSLTRNPFNSYFVHPSKIPVYASTKENYPEFKPLCTNWYHKEGQVIAEANITNMASTTANEKVAELTGKSSGNSSFESY